MVWESVREFLDMKLFRLGNVTVSVGGTAYFITLLVLLFVITSHLKKWLRTVLARTNLGRNERHSIGSIFQYCAILLGLLVIAQISGLDLTTLNVLAGALGVGLAFGLQNITSNFISGLIILFERPIRIGDRVVVGDVEGDVAEIHARSTTVISNDNIAIIVPNARFISENVINWSYHKEMIRFSVPVCVAYHANPRHVETLLLDVARANPDVLSEPKPVVRLTRLEPNALTLQLCVWSSTLIHRKGKLVSDLNFAIYETLTQHHIPMPAPQQQIQVTEEIDVRLTPDGKTKKIA